LRPTIADGLASDVIHALEATVATALTARVAAATQMSGTIASMTMVVGRPAVFVKNQHGLGTKELIMMKTLGGGTQSSRGGSINRAMLATTNGKITTKDMHLARAAVAVAGEAMGGKLGVKVLAH